MYIKKIGGRLPLCGRQVTTSIKKTLAWKQRSSRLDGFTLLRSSTNTCPSVWRVYNIPHPSPISSRPTKLRAMIAILFLFCDCQSRLRLQRLAGNNNDIHSKCAVRSAVQEMKWNIKRKKKIKHKQRNNKTTWKMNRKMAAAGDWKIGAISESVIRPVRGTPPFFSV